MKKLIFKKVALAYTIMLMAFLLAIRLSDAIYPDSFSNKGLLQGITLSVLTISFLMFLRYKVDNYIPKNIGLNSTKKSLLFFFVGVSIYLVPIILNLLFIKFTGWAEISLNSKSINSFLIGIFSVFLFEALPEELIFRGYIYSNLNVFQAKWKAALISVLLFVSFPVFLTLIESAFLKNEILVGGKNFITFPYLIILFLFGCFTTYLRILTKSIWIGVGFHLLFVYYNRLFGTKTTDLIQISHVTNDSYKLIFPVLLMLTIIALIVYPLLTKHKISWAEKSA